MADFILIIIIVASIRIFSIQLKNRNITTLRSLSILSLINAIIFFSKVYFMGEHGYSLLRAISYSIAMALIFLPITYAIYRKD
ncbi:hypothetical protein F480_09075 [Bibersteinia trehalosi Y31]|uniref:Uncharacterized protein n=1 Tax=Bibersteinia trehalosi Y31 TaxID=1261658 RepID=A0A179CZH7_BIBTR|nr:hypothetical protein [Bibersteinia trehalosi]OAQ14947.1 hypothetical protein F480_09075 [Bibersteinia trehalosi Y31]